MRIKISYQGNIQTIDSENKITVKEILLKSGINSSMVLVCNNNQIIPQTSMINTDVELEVIDVGSGG
jgi:sulfur carrier protein ThiS